MSNQSKQEERLTLAEYAAQCRDICTADGQREGSKCGDTWENEDGDTAYTFCGFHFGPVLGPDRED